MQYVRSCHPFSMLPQLRTHKSHITMKRGACTTVNRRTGVPSARVSVMAWHAAPCARVSVMAWQHQHHALVFQSWHGISSTMGTQNRVAACTPSPLVCGWPPPACSVQGCRGLSGPRPTTCLGAHVPDTRAMLLQHNHHHHHARHAYVRGC